MQHAQTSSCSGRATGPRPPPVRSCTLSRHTQGQVVVAAPCTPPSSAPCIPQPSASVPVARQRQHRRRHPGVTTHAVAAPEQSQPQQVDAQPLTVGSIVKATVTAVKPDGSAQVQLANGGPDAALWSFSRQARPAKTPAPVQVGETLAVVVDKLKPLTVNMARLELYPGEALSHRQEVVARADEYLAWAADHPQDSGSYQAWLGTRLLSSFTQGINIALPPKNTLRTDRMPPWVDLRSGMLVSARIESVRGDTAFASLPGFMFKSRALLHVSSFLSDYITEDEFAELLQPGTWVKAIVKKVERPLVPGTPPKVYLTTVPLLADRSATQGQPSQPAAVSHSNEDDADGAEGAAWTAKDLELMNARASDRHTAAMKHWTAKHLGQLSRQLGRVARAHARSKGGNGDTAEWREGAEYMARVVAHKPFGVIVDVGVDVNGSTENMLHISRISHVQTKPSELPAMLPKGSQVWVRVVRAPAVARGGDERLVLSALHCEQQYGDWRRKPQEVRDRCMAEWEKRQKQPDQPQPQPQQEWVSGSADSGVTRAPPGVFRDLQDVMRQLNAVPVSNLCTGIDQAPAPELLEQYLRVTTRLLAIFRSMTGLPTDTWQLPAAPDAPSHDTPATDSHSAPTQASISSCATQHSSNHSSKSSADDSVRQDSEASTSGRPAELRPALRARVMPLEAARVADALRVWEGCDVGVRPALSLALSLEMKKTAVKAALALRVGGPQADTAFTDAQQEATQQGAALAALAQLPGEGVRPADPARLLTVSLTGLKDSVWLLRKAKHAGSITKGLGASSPFWVGELVSDYWLSAAGPALAEWCAVRGTGVDEMLASEALPTLQHLGWLGALRIQDQNTWQLFMDACFGRMRRRLLSPKPLVTFELPADVVSSGRDSSKRREPAPSQLLLQQALGLLHLGQLLWYQPRPEWWAATLCQLGDEIPQVWSESEEGLSPSDAAMLKRLRSSAASLDTRARALEADQDQAPAASQ